jgi:hypothetical protein
MRALTRAEIVRMHVEAGPQVTPAAVAATATSASSFAPARRGIETAARSWTLSERLGQPALLRRHPLTVEGVEIGSFDLALACGETPDWFAVNYAERRTAAADGPAALKAVTLSLGARSARLQVISSDPASRSLEIKSEARGRVPASLIRLFSESGSRALVVSTTNVSEMHTAIRVGNSGIGSALAGLQQRCGTRTVHATNARTGLSSSR